MAKFTVPAGHYWAVGVFTSGTGRSERLVVLPQFTVGGATTVHLAERSASSQIGFTTPPPAALQRTQFTVFPRAGHGDMFISSWLAVGVRANFLWVSPTPTKPAV